MHNIRQRIERRLLTPGAKLPSVRALADSLGFSKSTVVEAYDRLAAEGVIRSRPGSGFYVAAPLAPLALAATEALPSLPSNQITREMARQLGLPRLPSGALAQQGLHHVWARHCREKRCCGCPCATAHNGQVTAPSMLTCGAIR